MLQNLSIKNYAIIKNLDVVFNGDFCVITGETGAGKSIIMGALSLILGQRADTSTLNDVNSKCVVEGKFEGLNAADFQGFFDNHDLDYDNTIILRREISPSGKSRAFINDTPVHLTIIRELGLKLIDIHSQHSNLELGKRQFQLNVIDWYAGNSDRLKNYSQSYKQLRKLEKHYAKLQEEAENSKKDVDYFEFQFNQLYEAHLIPNEQVDLEKEQEVLVHAEDIKSGLTQVYQLLDGEEFAALQKLKETVAILNRLSVYLPTIKSLEERLDSQYLELKDISNECELLADKTESDPTRLEEITDRLNLIYGLFQKHRLSTVQELIELRNEFDAKLLAASSYDDELEQLQKQIAHGKASLLKLAQDLHQSRVKQIPAVEKEIVFILNQLGMPNAVFKIEVNTCDEFQTTGTDEVIFLFAANKGGRVEEITKVASGGEMSRLMLAIKTVVAKSKALPAIIFDEIDNGISGEIASKMGEILRNMASYMQVINITHLPQIASKGMSHYLVFKNETEHEVVTGMRLLNTDDRIVEIAKMLSGAVPTVAAIENAKSLMQAGL
ncbi:MAG: DNA repair protein RecN [Prolixibacteraceae bacterium]